MNETTSRCVFDSVLYIELKATCKLPTGLGDKQPVRAEATADIPDSSGRCPVCAGAVTS